MDNLWIISNLFAHKTGRCKYADDILQYYVDFVDSNSGISLYWKSKVLSGGSLFGSMGINRIFSIFCFISYFGTDRKNV